MSEDGSETEVLVEVVRKRPSLTRVGASAAVYLFLSYLATSMAVSPLQGLFLHRACHDRGLSTDRCKDKIDGVKVPGYDDAQKKASTAVSTWTVCGGLAQLAVCALLGALGDEYGRRLPLVSPTAGGAMSAAAIAALPASRQDDVLMAVTFFVYLVGGQYVTNQACFAALADVTQTVEPRRRARVFAAIESATWLGLVAGPVLAGYLTSWVGEQRTFWAVAGVNLANLLITTATFPETLEESRRVPVDWRKANPLASLRLFLADATTCMYGVAMLSGLIVTSGGFSVLPLYADKWADASAVTVGYLFTTALAAGCVGLVAAMPLLLRCVTLPKLALLSMINMAASWASMSLLTQTWQMAAVLATQVLNPCFQPIVRTNMAEHFGSHRYGEALAAVGCVEQLSYLMAAPIATAVYRATEDSVWEVSGGVSVHGAAFLAVAGFAVVGWAAAALIPKQKEEEVERLRPPPLPSPPADSVDSLSLSAGGYR
eukprot:TRINITY_DN3788_c0_g2_i1.p1 TRINITY_DN3788_c0_g2~~TRINITY_DN3788_c0_g2_i1.p1  ORF type:complete len:499 (+),score=130.59 TRINITY_DN3788_c0_g2_i1:38-1498(+)